jgi:hypothetical protein
MDRFILGAAILDLTSPRTPAEWLVLEQELEPRKVAVTNDERGIGMFEPNLLRAKAKVLLIGAGRKFDGGGVVAHSMSLQFALKQSTLPIRGDCAAFTGGRPRARGHDTANV